VTWLSSSFSGMDKTIQRGDLGQHGEIYKIVPMHSDISLTDSVYISCWYKPLSVWMHRKPQTVVPTSLDEFNVRGTIICPCGTPLFLLMFIGFRGMICLTLL